MAFSPSDPYSSQPSQPYPSSNESVYPPTAGDSAYPPYTPVPGQEANAAPYPQGQGQTPYPPYGAPPQQTPYGVPPQGQAPYPPYGAPQGQVPYPPYAQPGMSPYATLKNTRANRAFTWGIISIVFGLISLVNSYVIIGIFSGIYVIIYGIQGLNAAKRYPAMGGQGKATAAIVMGVIALLLTLLAIAI